MPPRIRLFYSSMSLVLFFLAALPIYRELSRRRDIWWTPRAMLVPLSESSDRVEIFAHGQPLADLLQAGRVHIVADARPTQLTPSEVGLRFNNWDRVRAERLPGLLASAAGSGVAALMFLLLVTGRLAYRGRKGDVAA